MATRRDDEWKDDTSIYSEYQVEAILNYLGIDIAAQTGTHFLAYCPFHGNTDSPAFAVDKNTGQWTCFNPACYASSDLLEDLVIKKTDLNPFQATRLILKYKSAADIPLEDRLKKALERPADFIEIPQGLLDRMHADFKGSVAESYMQSRGFENETLEYFGIGYSAKQNMVIVPMHDPKGMPVGFIGRTPSHTEKVFKNSVNLPKSLTTWNFHRARVTGDTVIVCEASYDAMRVHQAGYRNVVALLGGHLSPFHVEQINRTFSNVIVMTDYDKKHYFPDCRKCLRAGFRGAVPCQGHRPGRDLGRSIANQLPYKRILWAAYDDNVVYPHGAKDASDMTDDEIRQCLRNAISHWQYETWAVEERSDEALAV